MRTLRNIFLCAVAGFGLFTTIGPSGCGPRQETAITQVDDHQQGGQQNGQQSGQQQQAQPPVEQQAPYVSPRAGAPQSSRALTPGEVALVRGIFGDKIDLDGVRLHMFTRAQRDLISDVAPGATKDIEFYGRNNSADYSKDDALHFGSFMHEMTFLLQNQRAGHWQAGDVDGYNYPLSSQWSFGDYGPQQQRAIIQDYALRFLHPGRQSQVLPNTYGSDRMDTDPFLIALVENAFPAAKQARLAFQHIENRPLTEGEAAILQGIFGDQIDTRIMTQHMHPETYGDAAGTASSGRDANYWGPRYASRDYSGDSTPAQFGVFIHENTHLWQFQTQWRYSPQRPDVYRYPLETKWKFTDYTHEQQAAIVEDYALYFLHPSHQMRWFPESYSRSDMREKIPLLRDLVENQFPGAKRLREAYEREHAPQSRTPVTAITPQARPGGLAMGAG